MIVRWFYPDRPVFDVAAISEDTSICQSFNVDGSEDMSCLFLSELFQRKSSSPTGLVSRHQPVVFICIR